MSNSPLVNYTQISPNKTSPRNHKIDTITIHCYVGQVSVERIGKGFANPDRRASCNYGIGKDGRIALIVDEADRSWCSSSSANDNRAITIEVASDNYAPYAVTDAAFASLIDLLVDICKRNGIPKLRWRADKSLIGQVDKQNMTVHRWFAAKSCPGEYLYSLHSKIADMVNERLEGKCNFEFRTLKRGDKGDDVKTLQKLLLYYGCDLKQYGVDGSFGKVTENAVKDFQSKNGLPSTGVVSESDWKELLF